MKSLRLLAAPSLGIIHMPDETVSVKLAADTPVTINVPPNAKYAHFSCGVEFFAAENAAASLPTTTPTAGAQERNPVLRGLIEGTTTLGIVATAAGYMTVSFYG